MVLKNKVTSSVSNKQHKVKTAKDTETCSRIDVELLYMGYSFALYHLQTFLLCLKFTQNDYVLFTKHEIN